jgi:nitrogen fixation protein NifU and related proteins
MPAATTTWDPSADADGNDSSSTFPMPYSDAFKDHLANPRNAGELDDANAIAEETNPVCGDRLRLSLRVVNDHIEAARFLAYGCPPTLACGSALAEMIQGMTIEAANNLTRNEVVAAVGGLSSRKQHAASLAIETLRSALVNYAHEPTINDRQMSG